METLKKQIKILLPETQVNDLNKKAAAAGLSREEFCRRVLAGASVREAPPADLPLLIREMRNAGASLSCLVRKAEGNDPALSAASAQALTEIRKAVSLVIGVYAIGDRTWR